MARALRFLRWWIAELAALVPAAWRGPGRSRDPVLHFKLSGGRIEVTRQHQGRSEFVGAVSARARANDAEQAGEWTELKVRIDGLRRERPEVILDVPDEYVLSTRLELPFVAEDDLAKALSYQIENETPFHRDGVYLNYRLLERDAARKRLGVQVELVPRQVADDSLSLLENWELRQAPGETGTGESGTCLRFVPDTHRTGRALYSRGGLLALNGALLAVLVIALSWKQQATLDELREKIDAERKATAEVLELHRRVEQLETELRFLAEQKAQKPAMVEVLEKLSTALSDSTWLYRLEVSGREVNFYGASDSATSLIEPLEASGLFSDIRFGAPVTQDPVSGREQFELNAELAGVARPAREDGT